MLVVGQICGLRNGDGWFSAAQVDELFDSLRVPRPASSSTTLGQLAQKEFSIRRPAEPRWTLTPRGVERVIEAVGEIELEPLLNRLANTAGADLGHVRHALIPPSLAPAKWAHAISALLEKFPFDKNVFCMTRFATGDERDGPLKAAIVTARSALAAHDLTLQLASDRILDDDVFGNVAAHMWACQYGLAICEDRLGRGLNYNVMIEVGAMVVSGRRCVLLRDRTSPPLPTDFVGHIYKSIELEDQAVVGTAVHAWAALDLGLGRCSRCETN